MDEIVLRGIAILVIEVVIIINAKNLGWNVEIKENHELVLTKPTRKLTDVDKDTRVLLNSLAKGTGCTGNFDTSRIDNMHIITRT
jgi:hypothetical protein